MFRMLHESNIGESHLAQTVAISCDAWADQCDEENTKGNCRATCGLGVDSVESCSNVGMGCYERAHCCDQDLQH